MHREIIDLGRHNNELSDIPKQLSDNQLLIIGDGNRGDKFDQLAEKLEGIVEVGFREPPTVVLSQAFFDPFFNRNKIGSSSVDVAGPSPQLAQQIIRGNFSNEQYELLSQVFSLFPPGTPLMVRGSGADKGRGVGIDHSEAILQFPKFRKALQRVVASEYSPRAFAFRQELNLPLSYGVIIQPMIGKRFNKYGTDYFAPIVSGYGYTSTPQSDGVLYMAVGFDGVNKNDVHRFESDEVLSGEDLNFYIQRKRNEITFGMDIARRSSLLGLPTGSMMRDQYRFEGEALDTKHGEIHSTNLGDIVYPGSHSIYVHHILSGLKKLEHRYGTPQYYEYAVKDHEKGSQIYVVQIADVGKVEHTIDFLVRGDTLLEADTVTGDIADTFSTIVFCDTESDITQLQHFNQQVSSDYILVFSGNLVSHGQKRSLGLDYEALQRARVIIELPTAQHIDATIDHLRSIIDMTDRVFGTMEREYFGFENTLEQDSSKPLKVYRGNFHVLASERQNRLVLSKEN